MLHPHFAVSLLIIYPTFTEQTIMSSTTNSAAHTMDPNIPVSEMVELMPDMRNILLECHKQHHETNAPSSSGFTDSPV
ncbi:hypothetical protein C8R42DRAFT_664991 [Lentinula raphanica]|nr:hypothetical protein C8R42DRAFT_664991 [Lentinula raphanica]